MRRQFKILAASLVCVSLSGCASIENPEDCDIRCGFGKNAEFKAENLALEKELEKRKAENLEIAEQFNSAKVRKTSLIEQEANLRALLSKQTVNLNNLESEIESVVAENKVTQADAIVAKEKIANLQSSIKQLAALTVMEPADIERGVVIVSQVVELRNDPDVLKVISADIDDTF